MDNTQDLARSLAFSSLGSILLALACIALSWWALQQFRFDLFVRQPRSGQAKMLQILVSIVLGYQLTRFILDYFGWSGLLKGLF